MGDDGIVEEDMEIQMKVLIVGNGAVGKSSMIQRYCKGIYTSDYKKTIGVDFLERKIELNGEQLRLMIWDTAGQEEFDAMTRTYYRDAVACVVAFSTTDRDSFEAVEKWIGKVEAECSSIPMVLVQNKVDLIDKAVMTNDEAVALADKIKLKFYRTSVQENYQVDDVFKYLAEKYLERLNAELEERKNKKAKQPAYGAAPQKLQPEPQATKKVKVREVKQRGKEKKKSFCTLL